MRQLFSSGIQICWKGETTQVQIQKPSFGRSKISGHIEKSKRRLGHGSSVECLPSKCKVLSSNPSIDKKKKKKIS
jgi:hypothetical protein